MCNLFDVNRKEAENEFQYLWRLGQAKDSGVLNIDWNGIASLMNKNFGDPDNPYSEATWRKPYQCAKKFVDAMAFNKFTEKEFAEELRTQKLELEKERVKIRDERNALRRIIREEARKENYKEQFLRSISEYHYLPLSYEDSKHFNVPDNADNDLLISCFDMHVGIEINNYFNKFNEEIFVNRLNQYLDKIFEVQLRHNSQNAFVVLSELISGFIHSTLRIENNQDIIEQFLCVTNYMSQFLAELSYHFNTVNVYVAPGNHGRLSTKKEDNLTNENMDNLVLPFLQSKLQNFDNIVFYKNDIESSIAIFTIRNSQVFSSHGDKDTMQNAIQNLTMFIGARPDIYLTGHRHTNALMTVYDSKIIQAGCLSGPDSYCMDNRLRNRPEQVIAVINDNGLDCIYDVKFI